ncbi:hypothetical protein TD95_000294 [Thielaviopsis punctulata]|uniref:methionine--tRNA ligase n=1 Tax=Thielaviopsis punctulata TaxID=72032 RepID=A0A0F4ZE27_9PEZI|nr:hypothetical protein TD95_000294 [Thielaviopsis punctulata]
MAAKQPIMPVEGKRNVLITSALPYVNNVPHLGNVTGSVLPADVFSRYCKARGYQSLYICGSDEYGTATETKALEEGVDPATLCAKYHAMHKSIYDWFNIDFDIFGRTPTKQQTSIVQEIFTDLWKNGHIEERASTQPFCPVETHNTFLADRFVEGECSICHDLGARGDQCDKCGSLLDPLEPENKDANDTQADEARATGWLINPRCKVDGCTPIRKTTKHLYIKLDELDSRIVDWFKKASKEGGWSANCASITQSWIDKGLKPRAITRDLKWGVPIPTNLEGLSEEEYLSKVFYVWFDACIGYISITANYTDGDNTETRNWEKWWKNPDNVKLYQFMGKDNVQFHTIIFPGSLLGTGQDWTKVHKLSASEYLNYENGKFSKSKGVGVFGNNAKDTGIDADVWRFYLLSRRPETNDTEFKWEEFVDANNNDLLKNVGNLVQRTVKFCKAKMDGKLPASAGDYTDDVIAEHVKQTNATLTQYIEHMEDIKLRAGIADILQLSYLGNKFLQDNKLDNKLLADEPAKCAAVILHALNHIYLLASVLEPYMPATAKSMFTQLGVEPSPAIPDVFAFDVLKPGHVIGEPKLLFSVIPAAKIDEWKDAYGGEELRRQKQEQAEKAAAKKASKAAAKERKKAEKAAKAAEGKAEDKKLETATAGLSLQEKKE